MSQPQISGGSTSTSGGMNQSGMLTTSAISAAAVQPSDQTRLVQKPPPRRFCPAPATARLSDLLTYLDDAHTYLRTLTAKHHLVALAGN